MSIQLELECSDAFHIGLLGSLGFLGWVLSLLVIPRAADRSGRKWIIIISSIAAVVAYIGIMFSTSIYLTYFFILFNGLTLAGRVSVGYVYMMELLPAESRTAVGTTLLALESLIGLFGALVYKNFHSQLSKFCVPRSFTDYNWNYYDVIPSRIADLSVEK